MQLQSSLASLFGAALVVGALASAQSSNIETVAGTGVPGTSGDGGQAVLAELSYPLDICVDGEGNVYFEDNRGNVMGVPDRIRRIDADTGTITTVVGGGTMPYPNDGALATAIQLEDGFRSIATDSMGNLYFTEETIDGLLVRRVDVATGLVNTIAGGGPVTESDTLVVCGFVYDIPLPSGDGGPASSAFLTNTNALAFDAGDNLYIAGGATVRRIDRATQVITTVVGNGLQEVLGIAGNPCAGWIYLGVYSGDGGPATAAGLISPLALAFDAVGNLYISDGDYGSGSGIPGRLTNHRIRCVDANSGIITTVCGTSQPGAIDFAGDGGLATAALIGPVWGLAVDTQGNLFLADNDNSRLRRVDGTSGIIETIAGDGTFVAGGDGGPAALATFAYLFDLAFGPEGDLYLTDVDGLRVRRISGLAANLPPVAQAGCAQSIHAGELVQLDGSASDDDNTPLANLVFQWELVARPPASNALLLGAGTPSPTFIADQPGSYVARLVVTDEGGLASAPDEVSVSSTNLAPVAYAGFDAVALVTDTVQLDGSASSDAELDPLTFAWALVAAPAGSAALLDDSASVTPRFVADLAGTYVAALFVDDGFGPSPIDEVVITALGGQEYAEVLVIDAVASLTALTGAEVTSEGNQQALVRTLSTVAQALESGKDNVARRRLEAALERTDGCALRGTPDLQGAGRDWVTDCAAQSELYSELNAALQALTP